MENGADGDRASMLSWSFAVNVGGIYACFMAASLLHETIYRTRSASGEAVSPWVVNSGESLANMMVAAAGMCFWEGRPAQAPQSGLAVTGSLQVLSKFSASAARVQGLPGPVLTLVKSARPLPVMVGQRLVAGTLYSPREYTQYVLVVLASMLVGTASSPLESDGIRGAGLLFLALSIVCDGYIGGRQKEMKNSIRAHRRALGIHPEGLQPFEMQFFTNLYMLITAVAFAVLGGLESSLEVAREDADVLWRILQYAACSAFGQIFVFNCMTRFDPLILSVVTSSRKICSVLLTLIVFQYEMNRTCLFGLVLAVQGFSLILVGELGRSSSSSKKAAASKDR